MKDFSTLPYTQNSIQHLFEDAPYDNKYYVRKNGEWKPIETTEITTENTIEDIQESNIQAV